MSSLQESTCSRFCLQRKAKQALRDVKTMAGELGQYGSVLFIFVPVIEMKLQNLSIRQTWEPEAHPLQVGKPSDIGDLLYSRLGSSKLYQWWAIPLMAKLLCNFKGQMKLWWVKDFIKRWDEMKRQQEV
jgi:hypothetical protein